MTSFARVKNTDLGATFDASMRGIVLGVAHSADMSHLPGVVATIGKYNADLGHVASLSAREANQSTVVHR